MFPNGDKAAMAGECAGAQGADAFRRMRGRLFADQSGWRDTQDPHAFFVGLARDEGLDEGDFARCLEEEGRTRQVETNVRLGKALGARGTPMFVIGGIPVSGALPLENFRGILDFILEERSSPSNEWLPGVPTGGGPSITALARNLGIGHSVGAPDAPVKILEFSDFGCGYCRLFQEETRPILVDEYVEAGLVQWTYVPFVLGIFPNGEAAAVAGECAAEQERFEPMRRRLYQDQAGWRDASEPREFFARLASEEGLDEEEFTQCLDGEGMKTQVQENTRLGQMGGVRGTPAFFINGFPVPGALPLDSFRDLLDLQITAEASQD
jgi:protein-disulfide isomerase